MLRSNSVRTTILVAFACALVVGFASCGSTSYDLAPQNASFATDRGASIWVGEECAVEATAATWIGDECKTEEPLTSGNSKQAPTLPGNAADRAREAVSNAGRK